MESESELGCARGTKAGAGETVVEVLNTARGTADDAPPMERELAIEAPLPMDPPPRKLAIEVPPPMDPPPRKVSEDIPP